MELPPILLAKRNKIQLLWVRDITGLIVMRLLTSRQKGIRCTHLCDGWTFGRDKPMYSY